jgi:poly(glycerol-phosphate) alpha-glucosyltransferase
MTPECNLPEGFEAGAAIKRIRTESLANSLQQLFEMSDIERDDMGKRDMGLCNANSRGRRLLPN